MSLFGCLLAGCSKALPKKFAISANCQKQLGVAADDDSTVESISDLSVHDQMPDSTSSDEGEIDAYSDLPVCDRTFATSNFKKLYNDRYTTPRALADFNPETMEYMLRVWGSKKDRLDAAVEARAMKETVCEHAFSQRGGPLKGTDFACALWTSPKKGFCDALHPTGWEVCSIVNDVLLCDDCEVMEAAMPLLHALNQVLVMARDPLVEVPFPAVHHYQTYRGSRIPQKEIIFFEQRRGLQYRVPRYLATSFRRETAKRFLSYTAQNQKHHPVLFVFRLHPCIRCKHAAYMAPSSLVPKEEEYLFAPYSAFVVHSIERTRGFPTTIELDVQMDNCNSPEDLPLAIWH